MVIRFNLKHLFAIVTIVAIASAFIGWVGISAALYILVIALLVLICFFPIGTSSLYWWLTLAGAFFSFVLYESTIPPEMDIRLDWVLLVFVGAAAILVLLVRTVTHYAKMGSVALQKRRLSNKDRLAKDEHTRSRQQTRE